MTVGHTLTTMSDAECRSLLAAASVGRIGLSIDALPVVMPVNFVVDGDRVVFRTGTGAKLRQALQGAVVCFEVDDVDRLYHTGWSVLVTGHAAEIADRTELDRVRALPLRSWAELDEEHFVEIRIELLSGRRVGDAGR